MNRKKWIILILFVLVIITSVGIYYQSHLSIWGFSLSKDEIKDVIVHTEEEEDSQHLITNQNKVLEIAKLLSKMEKHSEVEHNNFLSDERPEKYTKILLRTQDNTTYGGSLWIIGTSYVQDSNGYYWKFDYGKLSRLLNEAIPSAERLN